MGKGIKNTHPLKDQGWDTKVFHGSTLVALKSEPLIDALTGAPGMAFPRIRLRSGIVTGRGTEALHQMASSLGIFPGTRVFITAFIQRENTIKHRESQWFFREKPCG